MFGYALDRRAPSSLPIDRAADLYYERVFPMSDSVLVFLPSALTESFEIVLARAKDISLQPRTKLHISYCDGEIRGCVANPFGFDSVCRECTRVCRKALGELLPGVDASTFVGAEGPRLNSSVEHAVNGARSTVLTFYRQDPRDLNFRSRNAPLMGLVNRNYIRYGEGAYAHARTLIRKMRPDRIEYFNGRIVPTMSIRQAAVDEDCKYCAIEVSGKNRAMFLAHNAVVHDLDFLKARLSNYKIDSHKADLGAQFFELRRAGSTTNDKSYTAGQVVANYAVQGSSEIVSVFLSSTDEFLIFGDQWFTDSSRDPARFVRELRRLLNKEFHVVVRMHPNQAGDRTGQARGIQRELRQIEGVSVIGPRDKRSSYSLLDQSRAVITFGSTIGLEATYWGKMSILVGRCIWESSGVALVVDSAAGAAEMIAADPVVASRAEAIRVAAYLMDDIDDSDSLTYDRTSGRFLAAGRNYLSDKRRSLAYKLNRAVDRVFLRP